MFFPDSGSFLSSQYEKTFCEIVICGTIMIRVKMGSVSFTVLHLSKENFP